MFSLIATIDSKSGISKNGKIPWFCPEELANFKMLTTGHVVIMGRLAWDALPEISKPLENRINVVISKYGMNKDYILNGKYPNFLFNSVEQAVNYFNDNKELLYNDKKLFTIGGGLIYNQFLSLGLVSDIHLTILNMDYGCDRFISFPKMIYEEEKNLYDNEYVIYRKYYIINDEENQFLKIIQDVINYGVLREDITGFGVKSIFNHELIFNLSNGRIPLITTQSTDLHSIFEELMWILRGQTDTKILNEKKIITWNNITSRQNLDNKKLFNLPTGDIGPSYGFQMRNFGAEYMNCNTEFTSGFDQLKYIINLIRTNPNSREMIINLWNPNQLNNLVKSPCLYSYQFYVSNKRLSCKLVQHSSNIVIDGSHNCVHGALLIHMLCKILGLIPGEIVWSCSDIYIYVNQIGDAITQINRFPKPFPILEVIKMPKDNNILNFEYDNFRLINYDPWPKIPYAINTI